MLCDCFREVEVFREAMQTKKFETCEIPEHTLNTMIMSESCPKVDVSLFWSMSDKTCSWALKFGRSKTNFCPQSSLTSSPGFTSRCTRPPDNARGRASSRSPGKNGLILIWQLGFLVGRSSIKRSFQVQLDCSEFICQSDNLYLEVKISWYQIWKNHPDG